MIVAMWIDIKNIWKYFGMGLRDINMKSWLVLYNSWDDLLLIAPVILLQLTTGLIKNTILLDEVNDGETFYTWNYIPFSIFISWSKYNSTIYNLAIDSDSYLDSTLEVSTIGLKHTAEK